MTKLYLSFFILWAFFYPLKLLSNKSEEINRIGRNILVLIANEKYNNWIPLNGLRKDAESLKNILVKKYGFSKVIEAYDASQKEMIDCFENIKKEAKKNDSILIFYAGHGSLGNNSERGYWIPIDGGLDNRYKVNWVSNSDIHEYMQKMSAQHILIIVDSCYSGSFLEKERGRSIANITIPYFRTAYRIRSRQVITAGDMTTVPERSELIPQLEYLLSENEEKFIDPIYIYAGIRSKIKSTQPIYGTFPDHKNSGSFVFFLQKSTETDTNKQDKINDMGINVHLFSREFNSLQTNKILVDLDKVHSGMQFYFSGELKNNSSVLKKLHLDSSGLKSFFDEESIDAELNPNDRKNFSILFTPQKIIEGTFVQIKEQNNLLVEILFKYEPLEQEITKSISSEDKISGEKRDFSDWYTVSLEKAPDGYTLVGGSENYWLTGDRNCNAWADCRWKSKNDEDVSFEFRLQGHDEDAPYARFSKGHLTAKYMLLRKQPKITLIDDRKP